MQITSKSTEWFLDQWALWASSNRDVKLDFPLFSSFQICVNKSANLAISDNQAIIIDQIVAKLKHRDEEMGHCVVLYYFSGSNLSHVARVLGINRRRADTLVKSGTAWVDAMLISQCF